MWEVEHCSAWLNDGEINVLENIQRINYYCGWMFCDHWIFGSKIFTEVFRSISVFCCFTVLVKLLCAKITKGKVDEK